MKAFEFNNDFGITLHKDDCTVIWDYLNNIGKINFAPCQLDHFYNEFSELVYSQNWVEINSDTLEDFAEWLSYLEV